MFHNFFSLIFFLSLSSLCLADLNLRSKTSAIQVTGSARLVLDQEITNFSGRLIQDDDQTIKGNKIFFQQGILEKNGDTVRIDGEVDPLQETNVVRLTGNKTFKGSGLLSAQKIFIRGKDNRLEGEFFASSPIILQDSNTSVTCALFRRLNQNIELNGGTLFLEENLNFMDGRQITGSGNIWLNGRKLILGTSSVTISSPLTFYYGNDIDLQGDLHVTTSLIFAGSNTINGNGNILFLDAGGELIVQTASSLAFKALTIQGVSGKNIQCVDDTGKLIMAGTRWLQSSNYIFDKGAFEVVNFFDCIGSSTFAYQSSMTSTLNSFATMVFDNGFTFSYDPANSKKDLIEFTDQSSVVWLNAATLHVTKGGMQLKKGKMIVSEKSVLITEDRVDPETQAVTNAGLTIGNDTSSDDFKCDFTSGSLLEAQKGSLIYKNVNSSSWKMSNPFSMLQMDAGTTLHLDQTMNLGRGQVNLHVTSKLITASGVLLNGSANMFDTTL